LTDFILGVGLVIKAPNDWRDVGRPRIAIFWLYFVVFLCIYTSAMFVFCVFCEADELPTACLSGHRVVLSPVNNWLALI